MASGAAKYVGKNRLFVLLVLLVYSWFERNKAVIVLIERRIYRACLGNELVELERKDCVSRSCASQSLVDCTDPEQQVGKARIGKLFPIALDSSASADTTSPIRRGQRRTSWPSLSSSAIRFSSQTATGCNRSFASSPRVSIPASIACVRALRSGRSPEYVNERVSVSLTICSGRKDRPNIVVATLATSSR